MEAHELTEQEIQEMIFWGATGQAKALRESMGDSGIDLVALFDNDKDVVPPFSDVPLYYGKEGFVTWRAGRDPGNRLGFLVAIGGSKGKDRIEILEFLKSEGLTPLIAKHPTAFIAKNTRIGEGSQILAQAAVCVETTLGRGCIVNTAASVDHECRIEDGVHIGPGARLAGCVEVGEFVTIGTGAIVLPRLRVGNGAQIGAGSVVVKDVARGAVVVGNPARQIGEGNQ